MQAMQDINVEQWRDKNTKEKANWNTGNEKFSKPNEKLHGKCH